MSVLAVYVGVAVVVLLAICGAASDRVSEFRGVPVDFNGAESPPGLFALRRVAAFARLGETVEAYDEDGNTVHATVSKIDYENGLVYFTPDWSTWTPAICGAVADR